jgi:hypothetical protein
MQQAQQARLIFVQVGHLLVASNHVERKFRSSGPEVVYTIIYDKPVGIGSLRSFLPGWRMNKINIPEFM